MTLKAPKTTKAKKVMLWIVLAITATVFLLVVAFNQMSAFKKAEFAKNMPEKANLVTITDVQAREWTPVIEAVGSIRPNQGAMLSSQAAGTVSQILVKAGDRVKKGQLLVELDSSVEEANLQATLAQLPAAKANYQRFRNLIARQSASQSELDAAQATYNQLTANAESLKANIKRRQIYAPFDGFAGIVKVNVGEYINVGTQIVRVEDNSQMKVSFTLPQTEVERVSVGQKATITVDALEGQTFEAKVSAIDPAVSTATGLVELEAIVDGQSKLISGMFARLRIALPTEQNQVVVPQVAVNYTMYGETAYILVPLSDEEKEKQQQAAEKTGLDVSKMFRVKQVSVKTLDRQGIYAQLSSGIKVGDLLVTGGFQRLRNNALVIVSDKTAVGTSQPAKSTRL